MRMIENYFLFFDLMIVMHMRIYVKTDAIMIYIATHIYKYIYIFTFS